MQEGRLRRRDFPLGKGALPDRALQNDDLIIEASNTGEAVRIARNRKVTVAGQLAVNSLTAGVTNPSYTLDVANNIRVQGQGLNRGRLYCVASEARGSEIYFGGGFCWASHSRLELLCEP